MWKKKTVSFVLAVCLSFRPHGTAVLSLDGFSWNLVFECFSKMFWENSCFIQFGKECPVLCMNTNVQFWSHLAHFLPEWKMFRIKFVAKIKIHILCSTIFFFENRAIFEITEKHNRTGQVRDTNMAHTLFTLHTLLTYLLHGAESFLSR